MSQIETHHDKVLGIFVEAGKALSGEEAVNAFKEKHGDESLGTSDTIRTAISALTRKGFLYEAGSAVGTSGLRVKTWKVNDSPAAAEVRELVRQTPKQKDEELHILRLKNQQLEETNMRLLGEIERIREYAESKGVTYDER